MDMLRGHLRCENGSVDLLQRHERNEEERERRPGWGGPDALERGAALARHPNAPGTGMGSDTAVAPAIHGHSGTAKRLLRGVVPDQRRKRPQDLIPN